MARDAVRQPADPRLDKQLAWMGLTDTPESAETRPGQAGGRSAAVGSEIEDVRTQLRRLETIVWVLVALIGVIAIVEVVLLVR